MQMNPLCLYFSSFEKENLLEDSSIASPHPPLAYLYNVIGHKYYENMEEFWRGNTYLENAYFL